MLWEDREDGIGKFVLRPLLGPAGIGAGDGRAERTPFDSLLLLPVGENTGLAWLGVLSIEGLLVVLLYPPDMDEAARPVGAGDSMRFWPMLETGRGRKVAAVESTCGMPGMPGDDNDTDGHLLRETSIRRRYC